MLLLACYETGHIGCHLQTYFWTHLWTNCKEIRNWVTYLLKKNEKFWHISMVIIIYVIAINLASVSLLYIRHSLNFIIFPGDIYSR